MFIRKMVGRNADGEYVVVVKGVRRRNWRSSLGRRRIDRYRRVFTDVNGRYG